jgi:hypothetical protein
MKVQGGEKGIVFSRSQGRSYTTAFVEAFPDGTFLRGEGATIADAENDCWRQYNLLLSCGEHGPYERRHYTNGSGYCTKCGTWFSNVLKPLPTPEREQTDWEKSFWATMDAAGIPATDDPEFRVAMVTMLDNLAREGDEPDGDGQDDASPST